ncbi:MAG: sodium:alanine symporter family protein, partial [Holophagales bacterium]|nr:sodium:alanine symporter family protein [Holophagales bacterium]
MLETLQGIVGTLIDWVWGTGIPVGDETIPFIVIALLGTGMFLTLRLGFIQLRHLGHGFGVATGKYDDPNEPGDVSHFQALTTALSATVGIGNIAGVAIAIHWGGPGALLWMWLTAFFGMALKYSEVTLAQKYREVNFEDKDPGSWEGSVSGGPMYYIEKGLGSKWKPVAIFFSLALIFTSFLTGNAVQANTMADIVETKFGITPYITGLVTATVVGLVILGGIKRIGRVTSILAPAMATVYVGGALVILMMNAGQVVPTFGLIVSEAFNPTAGVAGTGVGAVLVTMMWGVKRGLFSNEAGQGSAPIAHAAAKTDEPVSEGVVALLEPFIDTLVICTMTGLVILITGAATTRVTTPIAVGGDIEWVMEQEDGKRAFVDPPASLEFRDGKQVSPTDVLLAWHEVEVDGLYLDENLEQPFTGRVDVEAGTFTTADGTEHRQVYGPAVENGAPLTEIAFSTGLKSPIGGYIVLLSVLLFGVSTAISWSYYGDRCTNYVWGPEAIVVFKVAFLVMHYLGAVLDLGTIWDLGDVALGLVTFPNLIALLLLSKVVKDSTDDYFERKPWVQNALDHK